MKACYKKCAAAKDPRVYTLPLTVIFFYPFKIVAAAYTFYPISITQIPLNCGCKSFFKRHFTFPTEFTLYF